MLFYGLNRHLPIHNILNPKTIQIFFVYIYIKEKKKTENDSSISFDLNQSLLEELSPFTQKM